MGQVNFYTLSSAEPGAALQFACRLTEKARELGHRVYIQTSNPAQARALDDLLWSQRPTSFIPHALREDPSAPLSEVVTVAALAPPPEFTDVLINLASTACQQHGQFARINEIVAADVDSIRDGRERYRYYREAGVALETFKL